MSNEESVLQYHEKHWLIYQERIDRRQYGKLYVKEAYEMMQDFHLENYLQLQGNHILRELGVEVMPAQPPDS